jgi:hypothetical protein
LFPPSLPFLSFSLPRPLTHTLSLSLSRSLTFSLCACVHVRQPATQFNLSFTPRTCHAIPPHHLSTSPPPLYLPTTSLPPHHLSTSPPPLYPAPSILATQALTRKTKP